jgi:hypothetical protein
LESVELRGKGADRGAESGADDPSLDPTPPPNDGQSVSPPNTGSAEGSGDPPLLPTGSGSEGGGFEGDGFDAPPSLAEPGCTKVDFLFVIDNSFSMAFAQSNLRNSFAGFMSVIQDNVDAEDFHIMVVDTDTWEDDDDREDTGGDRCRDVLGAGRRSNGTTGVDCGLPGSDRFITLDQPNLVETFSCMATVGTFGNNHEQPIAAMLAANSEAESDAEGCNAGFARRDAVLVVTLITNDDDDVTAGAPPDWLRYLIDQKGGDQNAQDALVVLGLVGDRTLEAPPSPLCQFASERDSVKLREFVLSLDHGALASVCSDDYSPFFAQAVQSIASACTEFIPPVIQ